MNAVTKEDNKIIHSPVVPQRSYSATIFPWPEPQKALQTATHQPLSLLSSVSWFCDVNRKRIEKLCAKLVNSKETATKASLTTARLSIDPTGFRSFRLVG